MEWTDQAVILGVRKHGETGVIAELMTRGRGRHLGLVHGGRSRTQRAALQPGNSVTATWRARLDDHLGTFKLEVTEFRSSRIMESAHAVYALQTLASHLRLLPERQSHLRLYEVAQIVLDTLDQPALAAEAIIRLELMMLDELGFGLDLSACAATGTRNNLHYVSPKTGRAVGETAGQPWADRLLTLPSFLLPNDHPRSSAAEWDDLNSGFVLTGFFLNRHIHNPRGLDMPSERASLIRSVEKALEGRAR